MERYKAKKLAESVGLIFVGGDPVGDHFVDKMTQFASLVEQETLERALMECEAMRDDMVKIKCSNQQIYGASQAVETIRSLKLPTN